MSDQPQLPGMPEETPLGQAANKFVAEKELVASSKLRSAELEKEILGEMKKVNVPRFKVSAGGENYEFELVVGQDALRCAKITKTIKKPVEVKQEQASVTELAAV